MAGKSQTTTEPAVAKLLGYVDQANAIARDCFAKGQNSLGVDALAMAADFLSAARAMQDMNDASKYYEEAANARR